MIMKEEEIIQAGIDYTLSTNPRCIAGNAFADIADMMNRNPSFEAGAKWMQEKMIEKVCKWIKENGYKYSDTTDDDCPFFHTNEFIENFKKAMKQ